MVLTNKERIGRGLDLVGAGLKPFVEAGLRNHFGPQWTRQLAGNRAQRVQADGRVDWDTSRLLKALIEYWKLVFERPPLGPAERSFATELLAWRNQHAHTAQDFTLNEADVQRVIDTGHRLLRAIGAVSEAQAIEQLKVDHQKPVQPARELPRTEAPTHRIAERPTSSRHGSFGPAGLRVTTKVLRYIERAGRGQAQIALSGFPPATKSARVRCSFRLGDRTYALIVGDAAACWRAHQTLETRSCFDELFQRLAEQPDRACQVEDLRTGSA
jgi:hypothetical protein